MTTEPGGARTTVHLLRHGEVHNPHKVLYGRLPGYRLSDLGEAMAARAAAHLAGSDIALVVSSPLERAQQTATPVAAKHALPIELDERVIESGNKFEGHRVGVGDGALANPKYWKWLYNPFTPSWGEPYAEVAERVLLAVEDARERARGHEALIVSHQLPIWIARLRVEGRRLWHDPRRRQCSLASITSLHYVGNRLTSLSYTEPSADLLPEASKVAGA